MSTPSSTSTTTPLEITLYGGGAMFGLPEASPYVCKTEVQLKMAGLPYRRARANLDAAPKRKMPYIDDGEIIGDSTFIRAHIERKHGVDLDAGLSPRQRAEAWAIERMLEDHLYWALVRGRWLQPENFAKGPAHFFDDLPAPVREKVRADVQGRVRDAQIAHGLGRHSPDEIDQLAGRSLGALSVLLADRPYLFGDRPSGTDATAFAMLAGILTPYFDTSLRAMAEELPNLVAYTARMMARFYPEHPWRAEARWAA